MKKLKIVNFLLVMCIVLNTSMIAMAEKNKLVSSYDLNGDTLKINGKGKNVSLFLLNPGKTKNDLASVKTKEDYRNVINYTATYNENAFANYSDTVKINNFNPSDGYLLCVKDSNGEENIMIKAAVNIYVSKSGNDNSGNGSESNPYLTLEKARNVIRNMDKTAPINVIIKEGRYTLTKGFELNRRDSGNETARITYKAEDGAKVVFSGGQRINSSSFKKVTDANILGKVNSETAEQLLEADLAKEGFNKNYFDYDRNYITPQSVEIYLNGKQQNVARWPDSGYALLIKKSDNSLSINNVGENRAERWKNAEKMYVEGYIGNNWYKELIKAGCNLQNPQIIELKSNSLYGITTGNRAAVVNLIEELDSPGEWYIDSDTMKLYFYPPHELTDDDIFEIGTLYNNFVSLSSVEYVSFENIEFNLNVNNDIKQEMQYPTIYTVGNGLSLAGCENVAVKNCIIKNIGADGIFVHSSKNIDIEGCIISNTGHNGIHIKNCLEGKTLNGCAIDVNNNIISKAACDSGSNGVVGIFINNGVGVTVENNTIRDMKNSAIRYTGNNHTIINNEIYNCVNETADAGAVYAGRSWSEYGTTISRNYFHTIGSEIDEYHASAVFWDDYHSGNRFEKNIVDLGDTVHSSGVKIGGGRDNVVTNNIFVGGDYAVYGEDRSVSFADDFYSGSAFQSFLGAVDGNVDNAKNITDDDWAEAFCLSFPMIMLNHADLMKKNYSRSNTVTDNKIFENDGVRLSTVMSADSSVKNNVTWKQNPINSEDLESIGIDGTVKIPEEMKNFGLIYPKNDSVVSNKGISLEWEESELADSYYYEVAADEAFDNVIVCGTTSETNVLIDEINAGRYYWRVTAKNSSKSIEGSTVHSEVNSFNAEKKVRILSVSKNDDTITYSVENNKDSNIGITAIAALKSNDGKLIEVVADKTKTVQSGAVNSYSFTADFKNSGSYIEVFLWDTTEDQKPISVKYRFE